jgi:hypothetical protein
MRVGLLKKGNTKKGPPGGWAQICFSSSKSYFFGDLKPHAKFRNPTISSSGRKVCGGERKIKITIITNKVDTSFCCNA